MKPQFSSQIRLNSLCEEYTRVRQADSTTVANFCQEHPEVRSALTDCLQSVVCNDTNNESTTWPALGEAVGDFRIDEELGRGGSGRVFLATDNQLNRLVVLKFAPFAEREARTLADFEHPNIVPIHTVFRDKKFSDLTVLCMPFAGAHTMADYLDACHADGPHPPAQVFKRLGISMEQTDNSPSQVRQHHSFVDVSLDLMRQLASGMEHAHDRDVLHLDIKPRNILLSDRAIPQFIDFNLAIDSTQEFAIIGGTPPYMSPEQLWVYSEGKCRIRPGTTLDVRSDVYSLGVVFVELLTGQHPFLRDNYPDDADALAEHVRREQTLWLRERLQNDVALAPFANLLRQWLAIHPSDRFQNMGELRAELSQLLSPQRRFSRRAWTHRKSITGLSLALCGLMAAGVAAWANQPTQYERLIAQSRDFSSRGELAEALTRLDQARAIVPPEQAEQLESEKVDLCRRLGKLHFDREEYEDARRYLELADRLAPKHHETEFWLAYAHFEIGDYGAAADFFRRVENWNNDEFLWSVIAYCNLANAHYVMLQYDTTKACIEHPQVSNSDCLANAARAAFINRKLDLAQKYVDSCLQQAPDCARAWSTRAQIGLWRAINAGSPIGKPDLEAVDKAIAGGCDDPFTQLLAAQLWDRAEYPATERQDHIIQHLKVAAKAGLTHTQATENQACFRSISRTPEFSRIFKAHQDLPDAEEPPNYVRPWHGKITFNKPITR